VNCLFLYSKCLPVLSCIEFKSISIFVSLPVLVVSLGILAFCLVVVGFQLKTVTLFCKLLNTLTSRLIQAVRKKTTGSHVALRWNISVTVRVTDLVEVSKNTACLVVCTRKNFLVGVLLCCELCHK